MLIDSPSWKSALNDYLIPATRSILHAIADIFSLPNYGNWCGPHHGGDDYNHPTAQDDLDRACMWHDLRYKSLGYFNDWADNILISDIIDVQTFSYDDTFNYRWYFHSYPPPGEYVNRPISTAEAYYYANFARNWFWTVGQYRK